jgi:phosphoglycolate phosphatase
MDHPGALLFDLDGTIIDSRVPFVASMNYALWKHGQKQRAPEELWRYLGPPTHTTFTELLGDDEQLVNAAVATYRAHYATHSAATTTVYDGIPELLRGLHGQLPLAVATSKVVTSAVPLLEGLGLAELFDAISGPAPEVVNEPKSVTIAHALRALHSAAAGAIKHPVMVGDRMYDVIGAREHGIPTIGVLWGSGSEQELRNAGAAALVSRPDEIPPLLGL